VAASRESIGDNLHASCRFWGKLARSSDGVVDFRVRGAVRLMTEFALGAGGQSTYLSPLVPIAACAKCSCCPLLPTRSSLNRACLSGISPSGKHMTTRFKFIAKLLCAVLVAISCVLILTVRAITYHPQVAETAAVTGTSAAPSLKPGQQVKVLSWNVQYLAGKEQVFWYDLPPTDRIPGAATRPTRSDLDRTLREVARIIREEDPDIILLQELDDGSKRTDYENQLALLLGLLPSSYSERTEAFYHRAKFVPESHIMGAVGMKLAILSKYRIQGATRHQLPCMPKDLLTRQFYFKRAVLEAHLPVAGARDFVVLNTHFDAFAAGNGTVAKQVAAVRQLLAWLDREQSAWCLGGDFNSLAPGSAYGRLDPSARWEFD